MVQPCKHIFTPLMLICGFSAGPLAAEQHPSPPVALAALEEVRVWGKVRETGDAGYVSPTSILTQEDMTAINTATTEDLVKFEPSLVIRRRFIGDANGTMGIRGANMFQTSRAMVFADGVPLHYFLQSRWSGAPRWTMVSASEIAQIEVIYGPFSAEYSGNAMGGVVLIETAIPQRREVHIDGAFFSQDFKAYGFDDSVDGFKGFASYGDKIGNASIYLSYNYLDNSAQPQSYFDATPTPASGANTADGTIYGNNSEGKARLWYGDTGVVETTTENVKFKFGYDFGTWQSLLNVAYEDRQSHNTGQSYLKDSDGNRLWSSGELVQDGQGFTVKGSNFNAGDLARQSLSLGLRLKGDISNNTRLEANVNRFDILKDETRSSRLNPEDPNFTPEGQISDYDRSGWSTAEVKLTVSELVTSGLELISGVRYEAYELNLNVYDSPNYTAGTRSNYTSRFGGKTQISAIYTQANWQLTPQWNAALGLRYEAFKSSDGYYNDDLDSTPELDLTQIPSENNDALSPKFSVGYRPEASWLVRYSLAKAYRFPIVEELFRQYQAYNAVFQSNPELAPEHGIHHNLMIDKTVSGGYLRVNIFQESIDDAIESQTDTSNNVHSFVPVDEVDVTGVEFIINQSGVLVDALDLRFNLTWTDAKIVDNSSAESGENFIPADSIKGKIYPRMPEWRSNLLATFHLNSAWDISANVQYASDSFGRLDNNDREDEVYGAQDAYTRIGLKTAYQMSDQWKFSVGIDNLTDNTAYVAHPWPGRSVYLNFSFDL